MISSLLTNNAAMTSLQALDSTQRQLAQTQAQMSSGLAVATSSDDAALWSIATGMEARIATLSAVETSLGLTRSILKVATSGMDAVISSLRRIEGDMVAAQTSGVDLAGIQSDVAAQEASIRSVVFSSSFDGVNLLGDELKFTVDPSTQHSFASDQFGNGLDVPLDFPSSGGNSHSYTTSPISVDAHGDVTSIKLYETDVVQTQYYSDDLTPDNYATADATFANDQGTGILSVSGLGSALDLDLTTLSSSERSAMPAAYADIIDRVVYAAAATSGSLVEVETMATFNASLSDALQSGVSSLVDADMNVVSLRQHALQVQEQLGIQALSIANQNSQLVLNLFQLKA